MCEKRIKFYLSHFYVYKTVVCGDGGEDDWRGNYAAYLKNKPINLNCCGYL